MSGSFQPLVTPDPEGFKVSGLGKYWYSHAHTHTQPHTYTIKRMLRKDGRTEVPGS